MTREEAGLYLQEINDFFITDPAWKEALNMAISALSQPESPKGRWVNGMCCSECRQVDWTKPNYCSNCGADMRGEEE